ncbi:Keratin OS=Blastopirellula marina DSM 3645 GN=DSM3645_21257 PE=4 SV=1 [Gemmataceae bacterium]|nr:Keratin OS=Blastopirellula marina DSM 3645 GN=DSM3645_21257 PE=4 SV=1 [Gemmataceae bacterium]VTT96722.1 Keratin OS=Blastopirellula marina DSM 3645 GN=DSM3645_21257 PE=4 SV=1 [Gemmataceae bacterium]
MYSVVLLAAMTPGHHPHGAVPAGPVVVVGCYGSACSGWACSGWSCMGSCSGWSAGCSGCYGSCYGGHKHCFFGSGGLFGHKHSCTGCCGCSGYAYSCSGWSCLGSCTGYSCGGCYGATWGGAYYAPMYTPGAVYGNVTNPNPQPADPTPIPAPADKKDTKPDNKTGANIKFQIPADAKLYVDGRLTTLVGTERSFVTPPLAAGKFFYDVKAELTVGGEVVVEQKRLIVEAGSSLVESFPKLFAAAEGKGDAVAGK